MISLIYIISYVALGAIIYGIAYNILGDDWSEEERGGISFGAGAIWPLTILYAIGFLCFKLGNKIDAQINKFKW